MHGDCAFFVDAPQKRYLGLHSVAIFVEGNRLFGFEVNFV